MSKRAIDFVGKWIEANIHPQTYVQEDGNDIRPKEFAETCMIQAEARGISRAEIEEDYGDLSGAMAEAIDEMAQAEVDRLSSKD